MPPRRPSRFTSSADLDAAIARVTPDVLALRFQRITGEEALSRLFRFELELAYGNAG